jgi:prepilin-type N-terminal cleavage/methylation domain-containing protein
MSGPSMPLIKPRNSGFTLLEVLFALALLSIGSFMVFSSLRLGDRAKKSLNEDFAWVTFAQGVQKILTHPDACKGNFDGLTLVDATSPVAVSSLGFPKRTGLPATDLITVGQSFLGQINVMSLTLTPRGSDGTPYTVSGITYRPELVRLTAVIQRPGNSFGFGTPTRTKTFDFVVVTNQPNTSPRTILDCKTPPQATGSTMTMEQACAMIRGTYDGTLCDIGPTICKDLGADYVLNGMTGTHQCDPLQLRMRLMGAMISNPGCEPGTFIKGFSSDGTPICMGPTATPSPRLTPDPACGPCFLNMTVPCNFNQLSIPYPTPVPTPQPSEFPMFRFYDGGLLDSTMCFPTPLPTDVMLPPRCQSEANPCAI